MTSRMLSVSFFKAEAVIRDHCVTGVQTCALPILGRCRKGCRRPRPPAGASARPLGRVLSGYGNNAADQQEGAVCGNLFGTYLHGSLLPKNRSEERRVGKECRSRWSPYH